MSVRDQILAFIPAAGAEPLAGIEGAFVRELSVEEVESLNKLSGTDTTAKAFQLAVVDEAGEPIFKAGDVAQLKKLKAKQFSVWVEQVLRVSGLKEDAREEAEKN